MQDKRSSPRVVFLASMFVDYSVLFCTALVASSSVLLIADQEPLGASVPAKGLERFSAAGGVLQAINLTSRVARWLSVPQLVLRTLLFRPSVVHAHEHPEPFLAVTLAILRCFVPVVLTVHDPTPHSGRDGDYFRRRARYIAWMRRTANVCVVHGDFCEKALAADGQVPSDRIFQIPMGTSLAPEADEIRAADPGAILFFGRMEAYKGLDTLLDALVHLRHRGVVFEARLVGKGVELERFKDQIEAAPDVVVHEGFLAPSAAIEQLQRAWILAAPYKDATQSGVVCAAFANGAPVIATRTGGLPDYVVDDENGLLVPPNNSVALADALARLLTQPEERNRLSRGADATAANVTNWSVAAARCIDLYKRLGGKP